MQRKTIERNVKQKMESWLASITDVRLRKSVQDCLLVSGGSITSLFLNEKVNDYDVYLTSMDVLYDLCKYYLPESVEYEILDGRKKDAYVKNFEAERKESLQTAVGMKAAELRILQPNQIRISFSEGFGKKYENKSDSTTADSGLPPYRPSFISNNAISLTDDVQIVLRFTGDVEEIHKTFDFIHATNYFTFEKGLVTNAEALESILTKQLRYQGSLYPLTSVIRLRKFLKRGWNINSGEMLKILWQVSDLDLQNVDVLEEQLIGVDVAYFGLLIKIIRDCKKEITAPYINTIIDRVFNTSEEDE